MCSLVATHTHPVRAASAALQLQPTAARAHVVGMVWYGMVWYGMVWLIFSVGTGGHETRSRWPVRSSRNLVGMLLSSHPAFIRR
jgi:hypothetical protein